MCQLLDRLKSETLAVGKVAAEGGSAEKNLGGDNVAKVDFMSTVRAPESGHASAAHHPRAADTIGGSRTYTRRGEILKILAERKSRQV